MSRQLAVLPLALSTLGAMQTAVAFSPSHVTLRHSTGLSRAAVTSSRQQLAFAPPAKALRGLRNLSMGIFDDLKKKLGGELPQMDYKDLKAGTYAKEASEYALAGEFKATNKDGHSIATFGGGCFWGIELAYQRVPGVIETSVGYAQGEPKHPIYELVCTGMTGHTEVVSMTYDPKQVDYKDLVQLLFSRIDPSLKDQVGNDRGTQYRHGVYYYTEDQKKAAQEVFDEVTASGGGPIYTELEPAQVYYPAEEYHQQYLSKGGRQGSAQSASKGCTDPIRCYG